MTDADPARVCLSVIIPVKDDPRIEACVASLLACEPPDGPIEILVIDNGSGPAMLPVLERLGERVTVLRVPVPGVYAARNRGIAAAAGEVIFFTDADCVIDPGWLVAGMACMRAGADMVQGHSGGTSKGRVGRVLQRRYGAHLDALSPGDSTEIDTRNLAVRRTVFDGILFNPRYRRVGDTEFGLRAELLGYRVSYCPTMRLEHAHAPDFALFVAKQVCHGWGAQRLMYEEPALPWHGSHLQLVARVSPWLRRLPGRLVASWLLGRGAIIAARLLQHAPFIPDALTLLILGALDKAGGLAGHLMFVPGAPEPYVSQILGRSLLRE